MSLAQTLRRRFSAMALGSGEGVKKLGDALESFNFTALMSRNDVKALPEGLLALGLTVEDGKLVTVALDEEFCYTVGGAIQSGKTNLPWRHESILRFKISAADSVRQLPPGVGYAASEDSKAVKIVTPKMEG
jgi:hypothetical protein